MTRRHNGGATEWDWDHARAVCFREAERVLGRVASAEDAAQEAVTRAWRHRHSCQTPEQPAPWIAAIARREALRVAAQRREAPLEEAEPASVDGPADAVEASLDLRRGLRLLTAGEREVVLARYWADLTQPQAASLLGLAEGTVKVRLHRARATLRAVLSTP